MEVPLFIIQFSRGLSLTKTIQLLWYLHLWKAPSYKYLVDGFKTALKNMSSSVGMMKIANGKITLLFQSTNQISTIPTLHSIHNSFHACQLICYIFDISDINMNHPNI